MFGEQRLVVDVHENHDEIKRPKLSSEVSILTRPRAQLLAPPNSQKLRTPTSQTSTDLPPPPRTSASAYLNSKTSPAMSSANQTIQLVRSPSFLRPNHLLPIHCHRNFELTHSFPSTATSSTRPTTSPRTTSDPTPSAAFTMHSRSTRQRAIPPKSRNCWRVLGKT